MQGFNMGRYLPPDLEGTTTANKLNNKRAPGTLRKDGTQTVRFEMPYAVWCHTCNPHAIIGQGVRFNAEKKKAGSYYSTPIWSFRIRHPACGGSIEIRTDPKNTAYVVVEGGKARDYGEPEDRVREGENGIPILTAEERERRREDAFARLEGQVEEKAQVKDNSKRIGELYESNDRDWDDPWTANKRLRDKNRLERKIRKKEEEKDEALKERLGTDMNLLPETEGDAVRASLVSFREDPAKRPASDASSKVLFDSRRRAPSKPKALQSAKDSRKEALRRQLISNTRVALNPFGR